ncbi:holin [Fusobacterium necrophorum subsp. funduliforme]|uniref:phage holin family protein n=1 Tax=Fusobacterium necrophorum TaxID=859 RepID=UPI000787CB07|nr:phage holin family protein [Fusobacterium necrophorum]KYM50705.1 holin [Fusobacterium necrophorum subsp. funduliforme]
MEKERGIIQFLLMIAGYIGFLLGGWNWTLGGMFIFMVSDYATGYIRSCLKGQLSSKVGYRGLLKKCSYIFVVLVGATLDRVLLENNIKIPVSFFGNPASFKVLLICKIIGTEGISIVENLAEIGLKFPLSIRKLFKQLQQDESSKNTPNEKKEP